jgi:hypothetical protein
MEAVMPDYQTYDDDINLAVRDTEREIFDEAVGNIEADGDENQLVDELSQSEGWDGGDLPIEEVAHRNMYGDTVGTNYDRPIALQNEVTLAAENDALRNQLALTTGYIDQHIAQPAQELVQEGRREQFRQHMENHGFFGGVENEKIDALIAASDRANQHAGALEGERINASMSAAHRRYGQDFADAYDDITHMDANSPLAREIVRNICTSADPGEKLMQYHGGSGGNSLIQALGPSTTPPFLPPSYGPRHASRPPRPSDMMEGGWGDADVEREVFDSAWDY